MLFKLEHNEACHAITLVSLERAANGLGCRLQYSLVPDESLEQQLSARARAVARRILDRTRHSMSLEAQSVPDSLAELQVRELADELKRSLSAELWDEP